MADASIEDADAAVAETDKTNCALAVIELTLTISDATATIFSALAVTELVAAIIVESSLKTIALEVTRLSEEIDDDASITFTAETAIEVSDSTNADVFATSIALQDTEELLSIFAETSKIPPPPSVEKGVCENALIPNIISNVH